MVEDGSCVRFCLQMTALVADSEDKLQKLIEEFGRVCETRKLKVNGNKSKVMRCSWQVDRGMGVETECKFEWGVVGGSGSF